MSRNCKKTPTVCLDNPLLQSELSQKLALLSSLLSSSYGPHGRLKQIHNNVGGHTVTTSTSSVFFRVVTMSDPFLKLIASAVINHTTLYSDCGLFTGIFCTALIENALKLNLRPSTSLVYKHLLEESVTYLRSDSCGCKLQVDFSSVQRILDLAHTVITSKRGCMLTPDEAQHITSLTVQAFLQSVPCDSTSSRTCFGRTVVLPVEGQPVKDSALFPGVLVEVPMLQSKDLENLGPGPYKTVLFSTSLSGDLSEMGEATLEISAGLNPDVVVLDQLLKLGEQVVRDGVGLVLCQKVIHPVLQRYLKEHGLVVNERLGVALMEPIAQMTGAMMVASLYSPVPTQAYGHVGGLCLHRCGSKELLQLLPTGEPAVSTMMLCHRNETMLDELKVTCQRTEHVLRLTLKEPHVLLGGGCMETMLSSYIRFMSKSKAREAASALNCTHSEFLLSTEAFCRSLQSVALSLKPNGQDCLMDLTHAHHWVTAVDTDSLNSALQSCSCGLIKDRAGLEKTPINTEYHSFLPALTEKSDRKPRLLDSFTAKLSALNVAVEMASLVLDVKYVIKDMN